MPLAVIPPDPKITDQEMQHYLEKAIRNNPSILNIDLDKQKFFAECLWKREHKNQGEFQVFYNNNNKAYLETDEWKAISKKVRKLNKQKCACCAKKATQVHHRDYRESVLRGENLAFLVPICGPCHRKIHGVGNDDRAAWHETERLLAELVQVEDSRLAASNGVPGNL